MLEQRKGISMESSLLRILWSAMMSLVLLLLLFSPWIRYACKKEFLNPALLSVLGLSGVLLLLRILRTATIPRFLPLLIGLLFLLLQLYMVRLYFFRTDWDSGAVTDAAEMLANGIAPSGKLAEYYSNYPNNILITWIYKQVFRLSIVLGQARPFAFAIILGIQCLLSFCSGILTFSLCECVTGDRSLSFLVYILFLLLIGFSPWVSIPYSDSMGLVFPVLILRLYTASPSRRWLNGLCCFGVGFFSLIGYQIKPTILIPLLSALLLFPVRLLRCPDRRRAWRCAALVLAGFFCGLFLFSIIKADFGFESDPERRLGVAHFLAMGHNEEEMGIWSSEDVQFSESFATAAERDAADLQLAKTRIREMGPIGLAKHYARKLLTCFQDGTFAWWQEGEFCIKVYENNSPAAGFLRNVYYRGGAYYQAFSNFEQTIWLAVLWLALGSAFGPRRDGTAVIQLSLLGMMLYCLLFEVRARYLYVFAPLYLVLAASGLCVLRNRFFRNTPSEAGQRTIASEGA